MKTIWFLVNTAMLLSILSVACTPAPPPPVVIDLKGQFRADRTVKKCVPLGIEALVNYNGVDPGKVSFQYDFNDGSALESTRFEKIQKIFVREGEFNIKARVLIEGQEKPALENTLFVSVQSGVDCAYIVEVKAAGSAQKQKSVTASILAATSGDQLATFSNVLTGFVARYTPEQVAQIAARPDVESLTLSSAMEYTATQTNPNSWGLDRIDQREAPRDNSFTFTSIGRNTDVYILDTGVRATHSEFTGRVGTGYNVFTGDSDTTDSNGHGTHVAALAAGATVGVARGARIIPVKVFPDKSSITEEWAFIKGLDWIAGNLNTSRRAVVNLSAGLNSPSSVERKVDKAARNFARLNPNVLLVLAAGNHASFNSCSYSPARVTRGSSVISVGASGLADERSVISNSGECVDLYAPGVDIRSASYTNDLDFQTKTGTSQAAPFVTGAAAAFLEANPTATAQLVKDALIASSTKDKLSNAVPNRLLFLEQPIAVNVQPSGATIGVGESIEFNALVEGTDNKSVTWEFGAAGGQSNGSKFNFSALQTGEYILTAISTADTSKRTSVRIVVEGGVLLNPVTSPMDTGSSQTLTARVVGLANNAISWDVTPNTGNPLENISGLTADFKPTVAGTYTVRVNSTSDPSKTASVQIRVNTAGSVAVNLDTDDFSLLVGSSKTIVATVSNAANGNVNWASNNPSVIGVSSAGLVSALGVGNAVITATSVQDPSKSSAVNVVSRDAVQVTPNNVSLGINENQVFNANVQGLGSTSVNWSISPEVGVSLSKGSSSAVFSANQIGVYTLTATSSADSSRKASVSINVFDSIAPTIAFSASDIGVVVGSSSVLTAVAADNIGVSKVEFFEGNTKLGEDSSIPFQFSIGFPSVGSRAFTARAVDAQGNSASTNELFILASYRQSIQKNTIATGPYHSFAVKTDGTVLSSGINQWGDVGDGTKIDRFVPTQVLNANNVVSVAAAGALALKSDGNLLAWGQNNVGQVGDGTTTSRSTPSPVLNASNIVGVAVGSRSFHNLALRTDGTVLAWGYNVTGQLGDSTTTSRSTPIVVTQAGLTDVRALAVGERHSVALLGNGKLVSWGDNLYGQRGIADLPTNTFIRVP
jgi:subtilisin family serine protease